MLRNVGSTTMAHIYCNGLRDEPFPEPLTTLPSKICMTFQPLAPDKTAGMAKRLGELICHSV